MPRALALCNEQQGIVPQVVWFGLLQPFGHFWQMPAICARPQLQYAIQVFVWVRDAHPKRQVFAFFKCDAVRVAYACCRFRHIQHLSTSNNKLNPLHRYSKGGYVVPWDGIKTLTAGVWAGAQAVNPGLHTNPTCVER